MKKLTFLTAILITSLSFAQVPNYVPTNGLVGWWPFNGNANDESGNGNNFITFGPQLSIDRNNNLQQAYHFNGTQTNAEYLILNDLTDLNSQNYTYSIWFITDSFYPNINPSSPFDFSNYNWQSILSINSNDWNIGEAVHSFLSIPNSTISNEQWTQPTSYQGLFSENKIIQDNWYNLTVTFNQNNTKIYLNGNFIFQYNSQLSFNNQFDLIIGGVRKGTNMIPMAGFNGTIDDIGWWNRALTACEIKNLYNAGIPNSSQTQTALDTYTWPVNNQTYTQSGTYSDTLVNAAGCDSIVTLNLTLSYTGINELNASQLVVSPNPTKDNFSISGLELLGTITSLEIKDAAGKIVKVLDPTTTNFSCIGLKAGVYFLAVTSNKTERVIKIIKE
jgi:hypothetical protein